VAENGNENRNDQNQIDNNEDCNLLFWHRMCESKVS
jgi:hypothetical protein